MRYLTLTLLFIFILSSASAINVEITVPEIVNEGEMISFSYEISSEINKTVKFIPHIDCSSGVDDFMNEETAEITPENPHTGTHSLVELNYKYFENGYCTAYIYILEPAEETFSETFEIKVADHLDAETDSYAPGKTVNKRVFYVGEIAEIRNSATTNTHEEAEFSFETTVLNNGTLVGTFNTETFILTLTEPGYYEVRVTATADNFMPDEAVTRFTVVRKPARAEEVQMICNYNRRCEPETGETSGNCALDCPLEEPVVADDPITANLTAESETAVPNVTPNATPFGRAFCLFDDVCVGTFNFSLFVTVFGIILVAGAIILIKKRRSS